VIMPFREIVPHTCRLFCVYTYASTLPCCPSPHFCCLQLILYGGYSSTKEEVMPNNAIWHLSMDGEIGTWRLLFKATDDFVWPQCVVSASDTAIYNFSSCTKPKLPGDPFMLDHINQILPAAVMQPSQPSKPEIVRDLGDSVVLSWDLESHSSYGDLFINQYLLEQDFGRANNSPFYQIYTGSELTFKVTGLKPGYCYSFRVRASNGACMSEYSEVAQFEATVPEEEGEEEQATVTEDDWYEQWLEDERIRKEDDKRRKVAEAARRKRLRIDAREYHEHLVDNHFVTLRTLEETKDHYESLHAEVAALLAAKNNSSKAVEGQKPSEPPRQLHKVLQDVNDRLRELEAEEDNREATREQMQTRLDHKVAAAELVHQRFHNFKREIAMEAENSRSGRKIPEVKLSEIERDEQEKDEDLKAVRLKNIVLKHELKRLEDWLQSKEVLGEGLHLIDFEQLKIENQTLNEKIEERNEELLKLRKKNTQTVQVLTHIKEKLQFVQADNQLQKDNLANLETDLALKRDELAMHKKALDQIRHDRYKLKEKSGLVDSDDLLYDFEKTKDRINELKEELRGLQADAKKSQEGTKLVLAEQAAFQSNYQG